HAFLQLVMPPEALADADRDALAERLAPIFGHDLADQAPVVLRQVAAMMAYNATSRLRELAGLPTLVVTAALDRIAPPEIGRAIASAVPGSVYVEIPDASHGVAIQHAGRINALLETHFSYATVQQGGR
ncbi:MAG: alpha/beta fold hydrolase, partial [Bryobacteraceae bacterium]